MRRFLRYGLLVALPAVLAAAAWWATRPAALTPEERPLVGRWAVAGGGLTVEFRPDRTWGVPGDPDEDAGPWAVAGGVLVAPLPAPPGGWAWWPFPAANPRRLVGRVEWDGPDAFRLHYDVLDPPAADRADRPRTYTRVRTPPHT